VRAASPPVRSATAGAAEGGTIASPGEVEQLGRIGDLRAMAGSDSDHFGDPVDPVAHDALDAGLQGLGGRRARAARSDEGDRDDPLASSTSRRKMSPPSACSAGRIASMVSSTCCRTCDGPHSGAGGATDSRRAAVPWPSMKNLRRALVVPVLAAALLAACSGDDDAADATTSLAPHPRSQQPPPPRRPPRRHHRTTATTAAPASTLPPTTDVQPPEPTIAGEPVEITVQVGLDDAATLGERVETVTKGTEVTLRSTPTSLRSTTCTGSSSSRPCRAAPRRC